MEDGKKREAELKRQLGQLDGDAEAGGEAKGAKAEEAAAAGSRRAKESLSVGEGSDQ